MDEPCTAAGHCHNSDRALGPDPRSTASPLDFSLLLRTLPLAIIVLRDEPAVDRIYSI
jgi:hypothetical protein